MRVSGRSQLIRLTAAPKSGASTSQNLGMAEQMHLDDLPIDLFVLIFAFLYLTDLVELQVCSKSMDLVVRAARVSAVWKRLKKSWKSALDDGKRINWDSVKQFMKADHRFLESSPQAIDCILSWKSTQLPKLVDNAGIVQAITHRGIYSFETDELSLREFSKQDQQVDVNHAIYAHGDIYISLSNGAVRKMTSFDVSHHQLHAVSIQSISTHESGFVTCSKDNSVKLWSSIFEKLESWSPDNPTVMWSVESNGQRIFLGSSASSKQSASLRILQVTPTGFNVTPSSFHRGAVFHTIAPSPTELLTFGYDGVWAMWDSRISFAKPVMLAYDEDDYPLFTAVKHDWKLFVGTGHHSVVRCFDLRNARQRGRQGGGPIYASHRSSPIYSMVWSTSKLFCAVDRGISRISFL